MSNATNQEAAFEDEIVAWLQYPLEDMLEKSYCSDAPGQWSLSTPLPPMPSETIPHAVHVKPLSHEPSLFVGRSTSAETAHTKSLLQMKKLTSAKESVYLRSSNAEDALALGAHRAAGLSSQVGQEEFARVRTSVQPQASSLHGHQHSLSSMASKWKDHLHVLKQQGLEASEEHDRSVRVKPVRSPCTPTSLGSRKRCGQREPSQAGFQLSASAPISGLSRNTQEKLSIHGKELACSMQLTSASMPPSSTFSDAESKDWQKMVDVGKRQVTAKGLALCSRDSFVTSMDLSCKDVRYGGKRKLDTSDQLSEMSEEDRDDDLVEMKLPRKFSLSKRNRVPEAHNLSERNRRNRINEKLRVLQELIPNSSKTDKASVLDEAIEYMKTLQMQLQMLSMRNSMGMPPLMMIPIGLPQSHPHVAPLQQVAIGIPVGHAGTLSMGVAGFGAGMVDMGFPVVGMPPRPIQSAAVLENGIPFHSGKAVGSMEGYSQLGYGPLEYLPMMTRTLSKSQYSMHGGSEHQPYAHPCPGHEQYKKRGQNSPKQDR